MPTALADAPAGCRARIVVADPYGALAEAIRRMYPAIPPAPGVDPTARIGAGSHLGRDVTIGPFTVLGRGVRLGDRCRVAEGVSLGDGVVVGEDSVIGPRVVCYAGSRMGRRVVLKAGAVIGGDGFGYLSGASGHTRIPHVGGCILEDDVEIGSNSTVDRGSVDDTVIGQGSKFDNLVHVGHNVRVGAPLPADGLRRRSPAARASGDGAILAGHVGVTDHLTIGDGRTGRGQERGVRRRGPGKRRSAAIPPVLTANFSGPRPRSTVSLLSSRRWNASSPAKGGGMPRRTLARERGDPGHRAAQRA